MRMGGEQYVYGVLRGIEARNTVAVDRYTVPGVTAHAAHATIRQN